MFEFIYIEEAVRDHPRTREICARYPRAARIPCQRFGEVFNRRAQNFRLQKRKPALILAEKHGRRVLPAPRGHGIGGARNFYFSHMLNCIYDCRYCFLQGMYRSAHLVLFVNYEDFRSALEETLRREAGEEVHFFSGYDCDSLALEPVTGFARFLLPFFRRRPRAVLELRTKSIQIRELLRSEPLENCIAAFSLLPERIGRDLEPGVPALERRLDALASLQERGWPVGLRFDPLIYGQRFEEIYREFFERVFSRVRGEGVHSVSLGAFRLPVPFHHALSRLYPEERLLAWGLQERGGLVSYRSDIAARLLEFCRGEILRYVPASIVISCQDDPDPESPLRAPAPREGEPCHARFS